MTLPQRLTKYDWHMAVVKFKGTSARAGVLRVAAMLSNFNNVDIALSWPERKTLALELDLTESAISECLSILNKCGAIRIIKFGDLSAAQVAVTGRRSGRSQAYELNSEWAKTVLDQVKERVESARAKSNQKIERPVSGDVQSNDTEAERRLAYVVQNDAERRLIPDVHDVERRLAPDAYTLSEKEGLGSRP
jgi:hypothetical protein